MANSKRSKVALVLLSGGIDSAAAIRFLKKQKMQVSGLYVNYGQAASKSEESSAKKICKHYGIPFRKIEISWELKLSEGEIVGRNTMLVSVGLMAAPKAGALLALGIHSGTSYYDCSLSFFEKMSEVVSSSSQGEIRLLAPFLTWSKLDVYQYCKMEKVPVHLTYSCEKGTIPTCGKCRSCSDRKRLDAV